MLQKIKDYTFQYKLLFYLAWALLYFIFPAWVSLHLILSERGLSSLNDLSLRAMGMLGLLVYFAISAFLVNRSFGPLSLDKPIFFKAGGWSDIFKDNIWLVVTCCLALLLHLKSFFFVELGFVHQGLWMYDFSTAYWHKLFSFPVQYAFWTLLVIIVLVIKMTNITLYVRENIEAYRSNYLLKSICALALFGLLVMYSDLFPYSREGAVRLLRFPPVSKYLNLITYYAFGLNYIGPKLIQLMFYVFGAVFLYRTILMFRERETALLGATIYLFSPVIFHYSNYTSLASGTIFFMIMISFYFLRFIKYSEDRDLVLTAFFLGIGFLYKRSVLLMFIICFSYLLLRRIIHKDRTALIHFKVLLLSLTTILPFYMIGRSGLNFYSPDFSNLITSLDAMYLVVQSQLSVYIAMMFLVSLILIFFKKDDLSLYFGYFFCAYYAFFTLSMAPAAQRYSMAFYPAIAVLLAQLVSFVAQKLKSRNAFRAAYLIVTVYLISLCIVPRTSSELITFKYRDFETQRYPVEQATDWITGNVEKGQKILVLSMPRYYEFYVDRIYSHAERLNPDRFLFYHYRKAKELAYPIQKLKEFCYDEQISYIVFPFGPKNSVPDHGTNDVVRHLRENPGGVFSEAARFDHEGNSIFIYRLAKNRDDL